MNEMIINNISIQVNNIQIVNSFSLSLDLGKIYALMGPNGSGKSSLACALMGHSNYTITQGTITLFDTDITSLTPDKRAQLGLFLSLQYPCEIPGLTVFNFLKEAYNALHGVIDVAEFQAKLYAIMDLLQIDHAFAYRSLNEGFSGGEKKRCEMLQILMLTPKVVIFDEIDSGLDVDALKIVARGITILRGQNPGVTILLITHYQRILHYVQPDEVHVMYQGTLVCSGDATLAHDIELHGYENLVSKFEQSKQVSL